MNKEVSLPLAKLLKEKGFDKPALSFYFENGAVGNGGTPINWNQYFDFSAPTISEVVMWLYEKHGIWISLTHQHNQFFWSFGSYQTQDFNSPTEAYEAAIEHTLNNLI